MLLPETIQLHDRSNFEFHCIYFLPWKNQLVKNLRDVNCVVECIPASNNLVLILRLRKLVKYIEDNDIHVIHAHLPWAGIVARLAGKITGVPVIYTEHNKQERYHIFTRFFGLLTINLCKLVIAVSHDVKSSIEMHKTNLSVKVVTLFNGVNSTNFDRRIFDRDTLRSKFEMPADCLVVGTVAVFRTQKRLDLWLDIAARMIVQFPKIKFVVVGDGPLKKELHEKCKQLSLDDSVIFAGIQTDVRPYYTIFDVYLMTSIFEGLPIALLEAMAMECAIVTTDAGGIKEMIDNSLDGLVCSVNRPFDIDEMLVTLLKNGALRKQLGINARKKVIEKFSLSSMVGKLEDLYLEIVG